MSYADEADAGMVTPTFNPGEMLTLRLDGAADFVSAWAAIPVEQRMPSVAESLNKAGLLQQAAEIAGGFKERARSKKPEGEDASSRTESPRLDAGRE